MWLCFIPFFLQALPISEAYLRAQGRSLELQEHAWDYQSFEGEGVNASEIPNPLFSGTVTCFEHGRPEVDLELDQLIETGGKRYARMRVARLQKERALFAHEVAKRMLLHKLRRSGYEQKFAFEQFVIEQEKEEKLLKLASLRYDEHIAGSGAYGTYAHVLKQLNEQKRTLHRLQNAIDHTSRFLRTLVDEDSIELEQLPALPELKFFENQFLRSPKRRLEQYEVWIGQQQLAVERALSYPDITFTFEWDQLGNKNDSLSVGAVVPLPLFSTNKGGKARAAALWEKAAVAFARWEESTRRDIATTWARVDRLQQLAERQRQVVEAASENQRRLEEGVKAGQMLSQELLEAQISTIDAKSTLLALEAEYIEQRVTLEELCGTE